MYVQMTFSDIITCGASDVLAPNGVFVLEQLEGFPCTWEYQDAIYRIFWRCATEDPTFHAEGQGDIRLWMFFRAETDECVLEAENDFVGCAGNIGGHHGTALVEIF